MSPAHINTLNTVSNIRWLKRATVSQAGMCLALCAPASASAAQQVFSFMCALHTHCIRHCGSRRWLKRATVSQARSIAFSSMCACKRTMH
jgi:hypothetical protein